MADQPQVHIRTIDPVLGFLTKSVSGSTIHRSPVVITTWRAIFVRPTREWRKGIDRTKAGFRTRSIDSLVAAAIRPPWTLAGRFVVSYNFA